jgi:hypothetical protein
MKKDYERKIAVMNHAKSVWKMWKHEIEAGIGENPWCNLDRRQALYDCLNSMKTYGLIKDFNRDVITYW